MNYKKVITIEKGKRGGQPVIRGMRISVYDVLQLLAAGESTEEILKDFPELTQEDITAVLQFVADRERRIPSMHKLLFDQNLSYRILQHLKHFFPESNHVRLLNLQEADDLTIWQYAKENDFHIVSKDTDFNNINGLYGYPPKVVWIHTGNLKTSAIIELLVRKNEIIHGFLDNEQAGFLELAF